MSTTLTPAYTDVAGAATHFDVTPWTIRRWIKIGTLPAVRVPGGQLRIRLSDLDAIAVPVQVGVDSHVVDQIRDYLDSADSSVMAVVGPTRSGKTRTITAATCGVSVAHFTPPELSSPFSMARAVDADVAVIEGAAFDSDATSALASLTSSDPIQVRRKGQAVGAETPAVKVLIASNIEPEFSGPDADTVRGLVQVMRLSGDRSVA